MLGINPNSNNGFTSFPKSQNQHVSKTEFQPKVKYLVSEGTQTEENEFVASGPLFNNVDFSTDAHGTIFDCSVDEEDGITTGLADNYDNVSHKVGIISKMNRSIAGALSNKIASWIHSTRTFFYQTEYELLVALKDPTQTVRTSKSWFFGGERECLWGVRYSNPVHAILLNLPKRLYYQGFLRTVFSSVFNYTKTELLELTKVLPSVIKDRAQLHADYYSKQVVYLTVESTAVLEKGEKYQNCNYLKDLRSRLHGVLIAHVGDVAEMMTSRVSETKTLFIQVQKVIERKFDQIYPMGHNHLEQIDAHKMFLTKAFYLADEMSQKASAALEKVRTILTQDSKVILVDKAARSKYLKEQIQKINQILLDLRAEEKAILEAFKGLEEEIKEYDA